MAGGTPPGPQDVDRAKQAHTEKESGVKPPHSKGLYYFIMEYVDGVNLRELIRSGQCKPEEALKVVPQICEALQFAHDEGIVHRDIKPENILLDKRGRLKIADFGLARLLRGAGGSPATPRDYTLTGPWQVMGTPNYMAPEQMDDPLKVDHRADIYSLGVVFYEMLTGELPRGRFAPPSQKVQVDVRLDEVVLRALEQEPQRRYQQASEVKTDVETISRSPQPGRVGQVFAAHHSSATPPAMGEPVDRLRDLANFWMSPQPGFGKWVGWPMLVLLVIWMAATATVHVVFGQKGNYREGPILLVQGGGIVLPVLGFFALMANWATRRRAIQMSATQDPGKMVGREDLAHPTIQPRFSRFAIAGAVWALFGLLTILPTLYFIGLNRVWSGTAKPTDVIYEEPPLIVTLFMGALLAIGAGAPIGTTVFGALSIQHIKRSGGRIVGLPLAVADAFFFPLLILGGIVGTLTHGAQAAIWAKENTGYVYREGILVDIIAPDPATRPDMNFLILDVLAAQIVWFFAGRAAWRSIAGRVAGVESSSPQPSRGEQVPAGGSQTRPQPPAPAIPPSGTLARAWHEWWAERDRWFTRAVQTVLMLLHFICLIMFLSFHFSGRDVEGRRAVSVRIGTPSPWFTYETYPEPNVPFRQHINLLASSLLVAAIGLLAYYVHWRIEKTKAESKLGFLSSPKAMLIVWATLAVAAIVMQLSIASSEGRPKSVTPGPTPPKTGEVWFGNKGDEHVMFWGPNSPRVRSGLFCSPKPDAQARNYRKRGTTGNRLACASGYGAR